MPQALEGVRVLDFGQGVAGPYCGQLLGDHGADVIKVEPLRGDWARTMGAQDGAGLSGTFVAVNRNKRGVALDLRCAEGLAVARSLASRADVVVESFRPGVMDRLGLGSAALRRENPRLVYCSVSGFGEGGPNVDLPAGDSIMQAYGGLMSIVGDRDGQPLRVGNVVSDMLAGSNAFSGVLVALLARSQSGVGDDVRTSLLDSIVAFQAPPLTEYLMTGAMPRRMGNEHPLIAPSGAVRTRDGLITYTVLDHQWRAFCNGLGIGSLADDPRFATSGGRQSHREALNAVLEPIFERRMSKEWLEVLRGIDVLCSRINDYASLVHDPQVEHNGLIGVVRDESGRELPQVSNPVRLGSATPGQRPPPRLGEHTVEILRSELRMGDADVERLIGANIAVCPGRSAAGATT